MREVCDSGAAGKIVELDPGMNEFRVDTRWSLTCFFRTDRTAFEADSQHLGDHAD